MSSGCSICKNHNFKDLAVSPHSHADFSLDGGSTSERKLKHAISIGRRADTLTDHGIMSGLAVQWMAAQKLKDKKILPDDFQIIQGIEAYVIDEDRPHKPVTKNSKKLEPQYYHLTIHFMTMNAYLHFSKLSRVAEERAVLKYGEAKPLIYFNEIEPIANEITLGASCLLGPIQKNILTGRMDLAVKYYEYLRSMVGPEHFYVEVFPHIITHNWVKPEYSKDKHLIKSGFFEPISSVRDWEGEESQKPETDPCTGFIDIQKKPNMAVIALAQKYGDRVLISLDDHYGPKEDELVQRARLGNGTENWRFFGSYHAMTSAEAAENLVQQLGVSIKQIEEWVDNGYQFVENFKNYKFPTKADQVLLPTTEMVYGSRFAKKSSREIFWELVAKHGKMLTEDNPMYQTYKDRVEYELSILIENDAKIDFMPYFFLLEDVCDHARKNDIFNISRGSAGGSLVLYLLSIVVTDPIKYKLSFERFLNPGRIKGGSWPDVDLDWENRHLIIDYLKEKYGERFALISSDNKMKLKSSILDSCRSVLGSVPDYAAALTKSIKIPLGTSDDGVWLFGKNDDGFWFTDDPVAVEIRKFAERHPDVWGMVKLCIGVTRNRGTHAGGVVIAPSPVHHHMPVIKAKSGEYATAYDMVGVEETGGVKFDMLGVKTIDALGIAIRSLKSIGIIMPWGDLPEDNEIADAIIGNMLLEGVFQLNTNVARPYVQRIKPRNVNEIAALTALCRPGALDAPSPDPDFKGTAAEYYVECATGKRRAYFIHEDLREILEETHGVIVYQEQAMKIGTFAGYSEADADIIIRKGIGKKQKDKIDKFMGDLRKNLPARGWSETQIQQLVDTVVATANYSFNCLSGDTLVRTDSGSVPIKDIAENPEKYKVHSLNEDGGVDHITPSYGECMGEKEVYEVLLEDGSTIVATGDHMFKSEGLWKRLEEILQGGLSIQVQKTVASSVKVLSWKKIGKEKVYDITVPGNHNFILENGVIAHNCSHSISYSILAWYCVVMKYKYPAHYWKGMLTVFGDNEDKLTGMLSECGHMLRGVDILKSHANDWSIEDEKFLRMPLSLISGFGENGADGLSHFLRSGLSVLQKESDSAKSLKAEKKAQKAVQDALV